LTEETKDKNQVTKEPIELKLRDYIWRCVRYFLAVALVGFSGLMLGAGGDLGVLMTWRALLLYAYLVIYFPALLIHVLVYDDLDVRLSESGALKQGQVRLLIKEPDAYRTIIMRKPFGITVTVCVMIAGLLTAVSKSIGPSSSLFVCGLLMLFPSSASLALYSWKIWKDRNEFSIIYMIRWQFLCAMLLSSSMSFFIGLQYGRELMLGDQLLLYYTLFIICIFCCILLKLDIRKNVLLLCLGCAVTLVICIAFAGNPVAIAVLMSVLIGMWLACLEVWRYVPGIRMENYRRQLFGEIPLTASQLEEKFERNYGASVLGIATLLLLFPMTFIVYDRLGLIYFGASALLGSFASLIWILRGDLWSPRTWSRMKVILGSLFLVFISLDAVFPFHVWPGIIASFEKNRLALFLLSGAGPPGLLIMVLQVQQLASSGNLRIPEGLHVKLGRLSILAILSAAALIPCLVAMVVLQGRSSAFFLGSFAAYVYWSLVALTCIVTAAIIVVPRIQVSQRSKERDKQRQ